MQNNIVVQCAEGWGKNKELKCRGKKEKVKRRKWHVVKCLKISSFSVINSKKFRHLRRLGQNQFYFLCTSFYLHIGYLILKVETTLHTFVRLQVYFDLTIRVRAVFIQVHMYYELYIRTMNDMNHLLSFFLIYLKI